MRKRSSRVRQFPTAITLLQLGATEFSCHVAAPRRYLNIA